jgi:UDP-3-O-[3-hydroxymyristoyl] glucosamine N-acyltransferase
MVLSELARWIGAEIVGDASIGVASCAGLLDAGAGQLSFLANAKYADQLETTKASAVIVALGVSQPRLTLLRTADPYYAFAQAVVILHGHRKHPHAGVHPAAHVDPTATVAPGTTIYPGVYVGPRAKVGRDCILYPNCVVYDDCILGDRVIVHAGAVIGQDGYGYATHRGEHTKIPQVGIVVLEDDVEVGANCSIARASLGRTLIGQGTKIDSNVVIGHGVHIGPHSLLVAQVGVAGSTRIGHHATMGGQVGVAGHLRVGNNVNISAQAGVINDVDDQSTVMGSPAMPAAHARRVYAIFTQLPKLAERVKRLEHQVEELGAD